MGREWINLAQDSIKCGDFFFLLAEDLFAFQKGLCSMVLAPEKYKAK